MALDSVVDQDVATQNQVEPTEDASARGDAVFAKKTVEREINPVAKFRCDDVGVLSAREPALDVAQIHVAQRHRGIDGGESQFELFG